MDSPLPPNGRRHAVATLYAVFFVSGFCGLIYESIWTHYLKLLLGHAAYAQAVVLVVFIGGLAIGAWLTGRISERIHRPILWYAAVEALVAVMAFAFQRVFETSSAWAVSDFLPTMCGQPGPCGAAWLPAAALILPPSILLGTTFPLMSAGVMRMGVQPGRGLSLLYFLNSAGAALGILASGFILIPAFGLPGTILLAGTGNVLVAIAAYAAAGGVKGARGQAAAAAPAQRGSELRLLLMVAAITGLSSFIYEVVWIRMLTLVLGAATHSFELMLATFILGLAIGAWWIRDRIDRSADALRLLAAIQVLMGLLAVATLPLYALCYDAMAWTLRALSRSPESYIVFNLVSATLASIVMLPATICAGMTLPLVTAILLRRGYGERQVGQVYGVNTLGAMAGVLLATQLLIPLAGLKWALAAGAAIDVVLGFAIWRAVRGSQRPASERPWHSPSWVLPASAVGALGALVILPMVTPLGPERYASGVFRHGQARVNTNQDTVVFHRDGKTATVTVKETRAGMRSLLTNGKSDGATHPKGSLRSIDDNTTVLLGALGPAHHPQARRAAVIGMGTGTTTAVLLASPAIEHVDTIEIEPVIVEAAQLFRPRTDAVYTDARSRIIIDDARAHFSKTRARYDLVVSEPSNPWVSGVSGLFTVEFYQHVSRHLADDGHFVQWLHLYEASPELVASIMNAFGMVFPEFKAYATNPSDIALVARKDGQVPALQFEPLAKMPALLRELASVGIHNPALLAAHDIGRIGATRLLVGSYGAPANSDYFPYVDQRGAQDRFLSRNARSLFTLAQAPVPFLEFGSAGAPVHAGQVVDATDAMPAQVWSAAGSWNGLRYLKGETANETYLSPLLADYALVRSWLQGCSFPAATGGAFEAMVRVASHLHRGLDAASAAAFWRGVADGRCTKALSPVQRSWMELFAATGGRKAEDARRHARAVLAGDSSLSGFGRAYAVAAGVASDIAVGARDDASRLLEQQRPLLPAEHTDSAWFRYLSIGLMVKRTAPPPPP